MQTRRHNTLPFTRATASTLGIIAILTTSCLRAGGQLATFAGNAQHTGQFGAPAQHLNRVHWSTSVNLNNTGGGAHYGAPLITPANTVLVPVRTTNGFQISAFEGTTGRLKYTLATDYIVPPSNWLPVFEPVIATNSSGARLYYAGAGGTTYYIGNLDSDSPGVPMQQCFYASLTNYATNAAAFNSTVFINTPLTAGSNGVVYFGFRGQTNAAPAPLDTTQGGFARIDPDGNAVYVLAGTAAGDVLIGRDSHNCAPALSNDGATLYVAVKWFTNAYYGYLLGLDSVTLATKYKVQLRDPRNGSYAGVLDDGTASPTVAPDGDVFFGIYGNPNNGARGFLLHFSGDLSIQKPPGAFGWDYTPAIVPTNMVPNYTGASAYLIAAKYNNYAGAADGDGINRLALLDPSVTQIDPHPTASGLVEMREVLTVIGCTPDEEFPTFAFPYAVREWCINAMAVNPVTRSVFAPSEDGHLYRWDLAANSLTEAVTLGPGIGQPYVPTVIGPDGTVYTLNGGTLFALGRLSNVAVAVYSSVPDLRSLVAGQPVTFTAVVTNLNLSGPTPTGTVTFQDVTYEDQSAVTNLLAVNVPLSNGLATVTTSALASDSNHLGSHFITAMYSGNGTFSAGSATLVQKVHASATSTSVTSTVPVAGSNSVTFASTVVSSPTGGGTPTGMVSFWDGAEFLAQVPLDSGGNASCVITNLSSGSHAVTAIYCSDTFFAASSGSVLGASQFTVALSLSTNSGVRLSFTNLSGAPFTVVAGSSLAVPVSNWTDLGRAIEVLPGQFQFTDSVAPGSSVRLYRIRSH